MWFLPLFEVAHAKASTGPLVEGLNNASRVRQAEVAHPPAQVYVQLLHSFLHTHASGPGGEFSHPVLKLGTGFGGYPDACLALMGEREPQKLAPPWAVYCTLAVVNLEFEFSLHKSLHTFHDSQPCAFCLDVDVTVVGVADESMASFL